MADRVEYFRGYLLFGFAKKVLHNLFYAVASLSLVAIAFQIFIGVVIFAALYLNFFVFVDEPKRIDTVRVEECELIGREWSDETLSCISKLPFSVSLHKG
ncbi:MAG: hypothetical protein HQ508_00700 [Candidatus Marinimicrobia bacterium]|nr:hypothetical protein [Candidatus Neomarinimicrobiota bacterium]